MGGGDGSVYVDIAQIISARLAASARARSESNHHTISTAPRIARLCGILAGVLICADVPHVVAAFEVRAHSHHTRSIPQFIIAFNR